MKTEISQREPAIANDQANTQRLLKIIKAQPRHQHFHSGKYFGVIAGPVKTDRPKKPVLVSLSINGIAAWVETDVRLLREICSLQNNAIELDDVPVPYQGIFLEAVFSRFLDYIEIRCDTKIIINHVYTPDSAAHMEKVFSSPPSDGYHVLYYEIGSSSVNSYKLGLKLDSEHLHLLEKILLPRRTSA